MRAPPDRRFLVNCAIIIVSVLFFGLVGLLWYQSSWRRPVAASAILVVEGREAYAGMTVTIEGELLSMPSRGTMTKDNQYTCRFALPAGGYSIRIEQDGVLLYENNRMTIEEHQYATVRLPEAGGPTKTGR